MFNYGVLLNRIILFQLSTVLLYYMGPVHYTNPSISSLVLPLVLYYLIMLKIGGVIGAKYYFKGKSGPLKLSNFVRLSIWVTVLLVPITLFYRAGDLTSARDLGELYNSSAERRESNISIFEYMRMFFGYILFGFFPLVLVSWGFLGRNLKILVVIGVGLNLILAITTGVNKYIFDYIIIFVAWQYLNARKSMFKTIGGWRIIIVTIICLTFAGFFFTQGQLTRSGSGAVSGQNPLINSYSDYNVDDGKMLVFYSSLSSYLTQGYRALDLSLKEPFIFTWGVGNSSFLSRQADRLIDADLTNSSYPARIEKYGWDRYNQWSSFYSWWASDLTHIGVGFLMFGIGFYYSAIGNTLREKIDAASIILISYIIIALTYLSANNQIMQSGESLVGFFALFLPYVIKRKLLRVKK